MSTPTEDDLDIVPEAELLALPGEAIPPGRLTAFFTRRAEVLYQQELDELASLVAKSGPVCILCYERDHTHCHRQWIAEVIEHRDGAKVENLVAPQV